jgi:hypothetical protein
LTNKCLKQLAEEQLLEVTPAGVKVIDLEGLVSFGAGMGDK